MALCIGVIDKDSSPILIECGAPTTSADPPTVVSSHAAFSNDHALQLKLHYFVHCSLDIIDEKLNQVPAGGGGRSADISREMYLGQLISNEHYKAYGYATNTRVKFVLVSELANNSLKDQEIRAIFKRLHSVYCDVIANPFYIPGRPVSSPRLRSAVREILTRS